MDVGYKPFRHYAYFLIASKGKAAVDAYFDGNIASLFKDTEHYNAYAMITEVSGTTIQSDGTSDLLLYLQYSGITQNQLLAIAKGLL